MGEVLGALVAILIGLQFIPNLARLSQRSSDNTRAVATAQQQRQLIDASTSYLQQFATTLQATATATTPVIVTVPMLQAANNLLPGSFSAINPYGQTWQLQVLQPSAGVLQALVISTGGTTPLSDLAASKVASIVGAKGGFIPQNDSGAYSGGTATAYGSYGGWTLPTLHYASVAGGHLASLISLANGQLTNNYLYRTAVAGQPQLNSMQTDLGMTDVGGTPHNISGANNVTASGNVSAAGNVAASGNVTASGSVTATGNVSAAGGKFTTDANGRIGTSGVAPGSLPSGWTGGVSTTDVYAGGTVGVGTGGGVAASMTSAGEISAGSGKFRVTAAGVVNLAAQGSSGGACSIASGSSAITTDSAGVPLACVNGKWRPVGGQIQKFGFYNAVDGTQIPAPSCASTSAQAILVTAMNIYINPTASASYTSTGVGPWVVSIRDGANNAIPGGAAQVETFCVFN